MYRKYKGDSTHCPQWVYDYDMFQYLWNRNAHRVLLKKQKKLEAVCKILISVTGVSSDGVGVQDYHKIQESFLKKINHRLQVFNMRHVDGLSYSTAPLAIDAPGDNIYVYIRDGHAYGITTICGFLQRLFFCPYCLKTCRSARQHKCSFICHRCGATGGCLDCTGALIECKICCKYYQGQDCLKRHKENKTCLKERYCTICDRFCSQGRPHKCGYKTCDVCRKQYDVTTKHDCYITPIWVEDDDHKDFTYIAFDCETMHIRDFSTTVMGHEVCCICSTMVCKLCIDDYPGKKDECERCGKRDRVFWGAEAVDKFCKYAIRKRDRKCIIMSMNGGGYDMILLQKYIYKQSITPKLLTRGNRIIMMALPKLKIQFLDLLQFLPMSLANVREAMGVITAEKKGFGPYMLWSSDNITSTFDSFACRASIISTPME